MDNKNDAAAKYDAAIEKAFTEGPPDQMLKALNDTAAARATVTVQVKIEKVRSHQCPYCGTAVDAEIAFEGERIIYCVSCDRQYNLVSEFTESTEETALRLAIDLASKLEAAEAALFGYQLLVAQDQKVGELWHARAEKAEARIRQLEAELLAARSEADAWEAKADAWGIGEINEN